MLESLSIGFEGHRECGLRYLGGEGNAKQSATASGPQKRTARSC